MEFSSFIYISTVSIKRMRIAPYTLINGVFAGYWIEMLYW